MNTSTTTANTTDTTAAPSGQAITVWFLNGPNANLYGLDGNKTYGSESFPVLRARCEKKAADEGMTLHFVQSNHEGQLVDWIQEARGQSQGILINAAGLTYSSVPILDALLSYTGRIIEVHMSNIWRRESFRHHSYISKAADGVIAGLGAEGYELAIEAMARLIRRAA
ncbi:3-dehydroquinate dehydratase [Bordetella genomosp. 10]|uniref:3-dehydroquinate dehydratase n=1 Tax=Bordetella genomosp. 10 TaxID=1416804 RepID=A0A261SID4_9BORD|nr:type II 3-dehydroquinate dehydratase [Bordetella genomosp. 10]OZI37198.1 3-dehydroquinate dehydratase [Bordetella genomosp. 10]